MLVPALLVLALLGFPLAAVLSPEPLPVDITVAQSQVVSIKGHINMPTGIVLQGVPILMNDTRVLQQKMMSAAEANPERITVAINSGGGGYTASTEALLGYMDYLVSNGTQIRCIVDGMAGSLAAIILSHCSERYATAASFVMVHAARTPVYGPKNQFELGNIKDMLMELDALIWAPMRAIINDDTYFDENFKAERVIPVVELNLRNPEIVQIVRTITFVD